MENKYYVCICMDRKLLQLCTQNTLLIKCMINKLFKKIIVGFSVKHFGVVSLTSVYWVNYVLV